MQYEELVKCLVNSGAIPQIFPTYGVFASTGLIYAIQNPSGGYDIWECLNGGTYYAIEEGPNWTKRPNYLINPQPATNLI